MGRGGGILFEKMLEISTGKYVKPFCADDIMRPNCLQKLVNYMEENPHIDFAFGNVEYVDEKGEDLHENWFHQRDGFSLENTETDLIRLYVVNGTSMLPYIGSIAKREVLKAIPYNYAFIMMFDMSIWLSLLCKNYKIGYLNELCANYRIHINQVSSIKKKKKALQISWFERSLFWEIILTIEDVDLVKAVFSDSPFNDKLKEKSDIPFYICLALFDKYQPMTYVLLSKMLNNKSYLSHVEKEFGYGVKELRARISKIHQEIEDKHSLRHFRNKYFYSRQPKDLNLWQLLFLMIRRSWFLITLRPIKTHFRKSKKYSA